MFEECSQPGRREDIFTDKEKAVFIKHSLSITSELMVSQYWGPESSCEHESFLSFSGSFHRGKLEAQTPKSCLERTWKRINKREERKQNTTPMSLSALTPNKRTIVTISTPLWTNTKGDKVPPDHTVDRMNKLAKHTHYQRFGTVRVSFLTTIPPS